MTSFQESKYIKTGYDNQYGSYTFTLDIKEVNEKRDLMIVVATNEYDDLVMTSRCMEIKIDKKDGHEFVRHPYIKERIYSNDHLDKEELDEEKEKIIKDKLKTNPAFRKKLDALLDVWADK